jgi:hypothetical protein
MAYIQEQVQQVTTKTVGYRCDICGKEERSTAPRGWFMLSYGHNEWGNDSVDSHEGMNLCSAMCFFQALAKVTHELMYYERSSWYSVYEMDAKAANDLLAIARP